MSKVIDIGKKREGKAKKKKAKSQLKGTTTSKADEYKAPKDIKNVQAIIMMGNVGTGKTEAAMQLVQAHGFYRISHDDILVMMRGYDYNKDDVRMYHEIENMICMAALRERKDIIIDRTNMTRVDRMRWIEFFKTCAAYAKHITITTKVMDFGPGDDGSLHRVCIRERAKQDGYDKDMLFAGDPYEIDPILKEIKAKWEPIYGFFFNGYEKPTLEEGMAVIKDMVTGEILEAGDD